MDVFCDTSFLCALYGRDAHTNIAEAYVRRRTEAILVSELLEFEFACGVKHRIFRKAISATQAAAMLADFTADRQASRLVASPCNFIEVFRLAKRIALTHSEREGYRSFDILHVATALHLKTKEFLTFDLAQAKLAKAEGLKLGV